MDLGRKLTNDLHEWDEHEPIKLAHWQVRMVMQSLASSYDRYHQRRPSDDLPGVHTIATVEVAALIKATINDIALQTGLITSQSTDVSVPTYTLGATGQAET